MGRQVLDCPLKPVMFIWVDGMDVGDDSVKPLISEAAPFQMTQGQTEGGRSHSPRKKGGQIGPRQERLVRVLLLGVELGRGVYPLPITLRISLKGMEVGGCQNLAVPGGRIEDFGPGVGLEERSHEIEKVGVHRLQVYPMGICLPPYEVALGFPPPPI